MTAPPTTLPPLVPPATPARPSFARRLLRRVGYALAVLPMAVTDLVAALAGRHDGAARRGRDRIRRLLGPGYDVGHGPVGRGRVALHGLLGVPLGLLGWFLAFLAVSGFARGPLYGLADPGPYDHSWGGPNVVGAWAAHAWVWVGLLPVGLALWWGLASLHGRLTARLLGSERRRWVVPVTAVVAIGAAVFVRAWIHQL